LANTFLSRPCRAAGREAYVRDVGLVRDGPASWLLAPSSEVPLQERRVSESESVSAVTRRDCRDHFGCSVPILLRAPHTIHQYPLASSFPGRRTRGGARVYLPTNLSVVPVGKRWVAGAMIAHIASQQFADLTLTLPVGRGIPVCDHNGRRGGANPREWGGTD
jgi:hypothetical protein